MKYFIALTILVFGSIGVAGFLKNQRETALLSEPKEKVEVEEIALGTSENPLPIEKPKKQEEKEIDRINQFFMLDSPLPIVETVSFTSRVPWLKDRPAWIADYASHFETSRHFIARSLNRKAEYFQQKVHPGDRFNVFKPGKEISFHLVVDLSKLKMWFYYLDGSEKGLIKTYPVGLGKKAEDRASGYLTPTGTYSLGEKIAIYKPKTEGFFQDEKVEMIRIFGTRWIPFDKEIKDCTESAKGFGIHGLPWVEGANKELVEDTSKLKEYSSDGCIRMSASDIEEIFAIVITKPTTVEIVKEYNP